MCRRTCIAPARGRTHLLRWVRIETSPPSTASTGPATSTVAGGCDLELAQYTFVYTLFQSSPTVAGGCDVAGPVDAVEGGDVSILTHRSRWVRLAIEPRRYEVRKKVSILTPPTCYGG